MKKKRFLPVLMFLAGLFTGGGLLAIFAFSSPNPPPQPVPISLTDANNYFKAYYQHTNALNAVLKGFTIDRTQLEALNQLSTTTPSLTTFRIYLGRNGSTNVGLVVGVDASNHDIFIVGKNNAIMSTPATNLGPCPTVCDATSSTSGITNPY